jgi:hypothetical protein
MARGSALTLPLISGGVRLSPEIMADVAPAMVIREIMRGYDARRNDDCRRSPEARNPNPVRPIVSSYPYIPWPRARRLRHYHRGGRAEPDAYPNGRSGQSGTRDKNHCQHCLFHMLAPYTELRGKPGTRKYLNDSARVRERVSGKDGMSHRWLSGSILVLCGQPKRCAASRYSPGVNGEFANRYGLSFERQVGGSLWQDEPNGGGVRSRGCRESKGG